MRYDGTGLDMRGWDAMEFEKMGNDELGWDVTFGFMFYYLLCSGRKEEET